jgi:hypothetical protein
MPCVRAFVRVRVRVHARVCVCVSVHVVCVRACNGCMTSRRNEGCRKEQRRAARPTQCGILCTAPCPAPAGPAGAPGCPPFRGWTPCGRCSSPGRRAWGPRRRRSWAGGRPCAAACLAGAARRDARARECRKGTANASAGRATAHAWRCTRTAGDPAPACLGRNPPRNSPPPPPPSPRQTSTNPGKPPAHRGARRGGGRSRRCSTSRSAAGAPWRGRAHTPPGAAARRRRGRARGGRTPSWTAGAGRATWAGAGGCGAGAGWVEWGWAREGGPAWARPRLGPPRPSALGAPAFGWGPPHSRARLGGARGVLAPGAAGPAGQKRPQSRRPGDPTLDAPSPWAPHPIR